MKVSVITQYYKPEMGAPQNRLYEMCTGLKKLGADVSVITGMPNYPTGKIFPEYKRKFCTTDTIDGIRIKRFWLYASNAKKALPRIWSMLSFSITILCSLAYLLRRKNDYIIVESPPLLLAESALILAKLSGARLIMNVSDLWPLSARELGAISGDGLAYKALEKLERHLYCKSLFCMGQSQEIVDYISTHGAKNVYLFRNGVDPERFAETNHSEHDINDRKIRIVYAGLLGFAQGIAEVCRNVNFAEAGAEFHIYGAGGEQNAIEHYIESHPDAGIYYHGKVSSDKIPVVLSQADCTLVPLVKNIYGAVPSKIYESMAAGVPVLFCGEGEGRKIIEDNDLGWTSDPQDYENLASNIKAVASQRDVWAQKHNNCLLCASNKFNRPKQVKALYDYMFSMLT